MRMTAIASGSSGNCTYINENNTHILVDAGVSCKRITQGLYGLDVPPEDLDAIFITHEHSDHISGLKILSKKQQIPIYGTAGTLEAIRRGDTKHEINPDLYHPIDADAPILIKELTITAFRNTHDAADPVGYRIDGDGHAVAVATDLGNYTDYTVSHLKDLDAILIEANHDLRMLQVGPYPFDLKRRIMSDYGHLSNDRCGDLLNEILHDHIRHILLGHLSKENNFPDLAYETVSLAIDQADSPYKRNDFEITVARRDVPSPTILIGE